MNWIRELINKWAEKKFCMHKWGMHKETKSYASIHQDKIPTRIEQTLICSKCGEITKISV